MLLSSNFKLLLLSLFILEDNITFIFSHEGVHEDNIINAAEAFNKQFNIKHWMVHYDKGDLSKRLMKRIGQSTSRYTSFHELSSSKKIVQKQERILHLFLGDNFYPLKSLLQSQDNATNFHPTKPMELLGLNVWVIHVIGEKRRNKLFNVLKQSPLRFDSHVFEFFYSDQDYELNTGEISIQDVYKIDERDEIIYNEKYGQWNVKNGLKIYQPNIWKRRSDLRGHEFKIAASKFWRAVTVAKDGCTSPHCFQGTEPEMLLLLQEKLNFTFKVIHERATGTELENGSWYGKIGLVADKKVDFALSIFGVRQNRAKVVDYLITDKYVSHGWFYIKNPRNTYDWTVFFQPLYEEAWIGLLVFSFCTPLLIAVIAFFRKHQHHEHWTLFDSFVLTYKSLTMRGSHNILDTDRKKFIAVSMMMGGMIIYWIWESTFISYLTLPTKDFPFKSLEELYAKSNMKIISTKGISRYFFSKSNDTLRHKIWKERMEPYIDDEIFKGEFCKVMDKLVEDESYAQFSIGGKNTGYVVCKRYQRCEVVKAPFTEGSFPGGAGWLFPKRSPFLPIFNQYFWELKYAGHWNRIISKPEYDPTKLLPYQECETLDGHPISMHKVISLFAMFFGAAFISFAIFCFERFIPPGWYRETKLVLKGLKKDISIQLPRIDIRMTLFNSNDKKENKKDDGSNIKDENLTENTAPAKGTEKGKSSNRKEKSSVELDNAQFSF